MSILPALLARTKDDFDAANGSARLGLAAIFPAERWGIELSSDEFTTANYANLWDNELPRGVKAALVAGGRDQAAFAEWLGGMHYTSAAVYAKRLFERYQENRGWRVLSLGLPAFGLVAVGFASNYQSGQNHNLLAKASALLYEHAKASIEAEGMAFPGREVVADDWDRGGLTGSLTEVAGVALPADVTLQLKGARTTTVKKILASYFSIDVARTEEDLDAKLKALEQVGARLAGYE